jgi:xanthine/uracil permease
MAQSQKPAEYSVTEKRRGTMEKAHLGVRPNRLALVSGILIFPALLLCLSGLLQLSASNVLIHPVLVLGGLMLAIGLNMMPVLKAQIDKGNVVSVVRIKGRLLNLSLLGLSLLLLATIMAYGFIENFRVVAR